MVQGRSFHAGKDLDMFQAAEKEAKVLTLGDGFAEDRGGRARGRPTLQRAGAGSKKETIPVLQR